MPSVLTERGFALSLPGLREPVAAMTLEQRNATILKVLAEQTRRNTASRAAARKALIKAGIYTEKGNLRAMFGGRQGAKSAA